MMVNSGQRAWLIEMAEHVDRLGHMCADSITLVTTGGETISFAAGNTSIHIAGEPVCWYQPEPR